jgi:type I restriction enzyme S subunit
LEIKDKRLEMRDERLEIKDKRLEIRDGEWQRKKLKYVCKFEYGNSLSTEERIEGEIDVFGSNGAVGTHNEAITNAPCIIIGRKGSFGKVNWSDKPCFPIDTTYFIDNTKTNENLKWLYYALQSLNLDSFSRDTGVPGLNREDAYSNFINVPSLPTQARIVGEIEAHLGKSRAIGEKLQREIGLLKEYRQSLISEAVTGRVRV